MNRLYDTRVDGMIEKYEEQKQVFIDSGNPYEEGTLYHILHSLVCEYDDPSTIKNYQVSLLYNDGDEISTKGNYLFLNRSMFSFGGKVIDFNYSTFKMPHKLSSDRPNYSFCFISNKEYQRQIRDIMKEICKDKIIARLEHSILHKEEELTRLRAELEKLK